MTGKHVFNKKAVKQVKLMKYQATDHQRQKKLYLAFWAQH